MSTETTQRTVVREATLARPLKTAIDEREGVAVRFKGPGGWVDVGYGQLRQVSCEIGRGLMALWV